MGRAAPRWLAPSAALVGLIVSAFPAISGGAALALGVLIGLTVGNPGGDTTGAVASRLLKIAVVGLGFGMQLDAVARTGLQGVAVTAVGITLTMLAGLVLLRLFRVDATTGTLISGGTAICGGSAIAALGPVLGASGPAIGVALATVFLLNAVALYVFPPIGAWVGLSQEQFAVWAAVAIHDTSSVVGAAASYGDLALERATVLKLVRALWIAPLTFAVAWWRRRAGASERTRATIPWFIVAFVAAAAIRTLVPSAAPAYEVATWLARRGLVVTLYLIGLGLTRRTLLAVGVRPTFMGLTLWALVATSSLGAILAFG